MQIVDQLIRESLSYQYKKILGMRFAYLQIKAALAEVINNFEITVNSKTIEPLEFDPAQTLLTNTGGIWLNFKPL